MIIRSVLIFCLALSACREKPPQSMTVDSSSKPIDTKFADKVDVEKPVEKPVETPPLPLRNPSEEEDRSPPETLETRDKARLQAIEKFRKGTAN